MVTKCRLCSSSEFDQILDLGPLPLSNSLSPTVDEAKREKCEPVVAGICRECHLIQLLHEVAADRLFRNYPWASSSSRSAVEYVKRLSSDIRTVAADGLAVEIGSNDGLMLRALRDVGYRILGVEPSTIGREANDSGIPTLERYFDARLAAEIVSGHGQASVVVARNVIGHVNDLATVMKGIARLASDNAVVIIEVPYMGTIREQLSYDYFFHEHVSYFSVQTLCSALERVGMRIGRLTFSELNGGSLVCYAGRNVRRNCDSVAALAEMETLTGLNRPDGWTRFSADVRTQSRLLSEFLMRLQEQGKQVIGYGAAAKTVTMLNYCGVTRSLMPALADGSVRKQGRYTPGGAIEVIAPADLVSRRPSMVLIGPSNMAAEIRRDLKALGYLGPSLIPLPYPTVRVGPC